MKNSRPNNKLNQGDLSKILYFYEISTINQLTDIIKNADIDNKIGKKMLNLFKEQYDNLCEILTNESEKFGEAAFGTPVQTPNSNKVLSTSHSRPLSAFSNKSSISVNSLNSSGLFGDSRSWKKRPPSALKVNTSTSTTFSSVKYCSEEYFDNNTAAGSPNNWRRTLREDKKSDSWSVVNLSRSSFNSCSTSYSQAMRFSETSPLDPNRAFDGKTIYDLGGHREAGSGFREAAEEWTGRGDGFATLYLSQVDRFVEFNRGRRSFYESLQNSAAPRDNLTTGLVVLNSTKLNNQHSR